MTWRIVLRLYNRTEQVIDARDVAELRTVLDRARSDPDVIAWQYWRLTELTGRVRSVCPSCGTSYQQGQVRGRVCRCGLVHVDHECRGCYTNLVDPPYEEGCGPIPFDSEGVNKKYQRRRWRPPPDA